jgi:hypothetical protein
LHVGILVKTHMFTTWLPISTSLSLTYNLSTPEDSSQRELVKYWAGMDFDMTAATLIGPGERNKVAARSA